MIKRTSNVIFIFVLFVFLIVSMIRTCFFPQDVNIYENRKANVISPVTLNTFADSTLQDSMESALSDQAFFAQDVKKLHNSILSKYIHLTVTPVASANPHRYFKLDSYYLYGRDNLLFAPYTFSHLTERLDARAKSYNGVFEKYSHTEFFIYYIEKDTDLNFETNEKINVYDYLMERVNLPESNSRVFTINSFEEFDKYYYKTDHHWKAEGSKLGYEQVVSMLLGEDEVLLQPTEYRQVPNVMFSGSKATNRMTGAFSEPFMAYTYTYPPMTITENGEPKDDFGKQEAYMKGTEKTISYGLFYGGDMGEIIFDTSRPEKENILVIGESFDNAILKLIASHFNRTVSIDLRNYESFMGKKFSLDEHLKTHSIDKVLLIGNVDYYLSDDFILE